MIPPPELVRALKEYDGELRCRWAHRTAQWMIERKVPERLTQRLQERPAASDEALSRMKPLKADLYDGWRDCYLHVLSVPHSLIQNVPLILDKLASCDSWRVGGFGKLDDALTAQDEAADRAHEKKTHDFSTAAASEAYDRLQWAYGNRIAMTEPAPNLSAVRHEGGFLVRDRRVI